MLIAVAARRHPMRHAFAQALLLAIALAAAAPAAATSGAMRVGANGDWGAITVAAELETRDGTPAWFGGLHGVVGDDEVRLGSSSDWRSLHGQAAVTEANHTARIAFGTFHAFGLRYGYVEAWWNGEQRFGWFDGGPLP